MGNSYSAPRSLWWYGTSSISASSIQDDMAVISRSTNGFGYRPDDYGNTPSAASPLTVSGSQVSGSGVIATTSDLDYLSFNTSGGTVDLIASVQTGVNNLDSRLELRDASNMLIAAAAPSTSFGAEINTTLAAGTYYLVVGSNGSYGDVGQYTLSGTIGSSTNSLNPPTNLTATAASAGSITLGWTDNATSEAGYAVERSANGGTWTVIAPALPANSTAYQDATVQPGTSYSYRVRAFDATSNSAYSNLATVTTFPAPPGSLAASAVSSSRIDLSWSNVAGETGYKVERSTNGTTWAQLATTGTDVTTYQDLSVVANTTYSYRVRASNGGGDSSYSPTATATTPGSVTNPLATPGNLTVTNVAGNQINLQWKDNTTNESGYQIERSSDGGTTWTVLSSALSANSTTYYDARVAAGTSYSYRVRAFNATATSDYSNLANATTPPLAPTGLTATAISPSRIDLSWNAVPSATGYQIYRSKNGSTWIPLATTGGDVTSWQDTGLTANTKYFYRMQAKNSGGDSTFSTAVSATTPVAASLWTGTTTTVSYGGGTSVTSNTWQGWSTASVPTRSTAAPKPTASAGTNTRGHDSVSSPAWLEEQGLDLVFANSDWLDQQWLV
jgi:fibronectin type 3 domain-containing protein